MNNMDLHIGSEADYDRALREIESLMDAGARAGTPEGNRLHLLSLLVEDYERQKVEISAPDPIEAIKFRMEQMNLQPRDLVPLIGSRSKVSEILSRKRPLTLSMVRALNKGLGIPATALLREQTLFDMEHQSVDWEKFPIRAMWQRGWFGSGKSSQMSSPAVLVQSFFAPLGEHWARSALYKHTRHLRSARHMDWFALTAWNGRVCLRALESPPSVAFDSNKLTLDFMRELSRLSTLSDGPRHAIDYVRSVGVAVIVEPHLPETYLDGAALLATPDRPVIALTLRHDRIDNFWFVLMHELIHVAKHLRSELAAVYDDLDVDDSDQLEQEADSLAGEALIPKAVWEHSPARMLRTPEAVEHLARQLRIHPAIVAGRIRHQYKSFRVLNRLVGQGEVRKLFPATQGSEKE